MEIMAALFYHLVTAFVDVLFKGHIKAKYNYNWAEVPNFWKSEKLALRSLLKWEPILFSLTYILFLTILVVFIRPCSSFLLLFNLYVLILGIVGTECIFYWWIGSLTGWERAHWRKALSYKDLPDKLYRFEIPPECPWLEKFPMIYMYVKAEKQVMYIFLLLALTGLITTHSIINW